MGRSIGRRRSAAAVLVTCALGAFVLARGLPDQDAPVRAWLALRDALPATTIVPPWAAGAIGAPARPAAPAVAPIPLADNGPYASLGVGLSRAAWESAHGSPIGAAGERLIYGDGKLVVGFRDGNVASVELIWGERPPLLEEARIAGRGWLPRDARFVRTYVPPETPGQPFIDVYASGSLGARFPDAPWRTSPWTRGNPGTLIVGHRLTPDLRVTATVVSAGDLP